MNDFTKDELEYMKFWGELHGCTSYATQQKIQPLLDKIQNLIKFYDIPFAAINNPNKSWRPDKDE